MDKYDLEVLESHYTIHRFQPTQPVPDAVYDSPFYWVAKTDDELSVVCDSAVEVAGGEQSKGWACLRVIGPIDFSETGVLAGISNALAAAHISIFALSTFDTDYILLPSAQQDAAVRVLVARGYRIRAPGSGKT